MSNAQFPTLKGLTWDYTLTPTFSTGPQQATNGREVRAAFWSAPLWKISLTYELLRDDDTHVNDAGYSELAQIEGFFIARQGSFDSFVINLDQLTKKADQTQLSGQPIGTGDGVTTQFQLVRNLGGTLVMVQEPAGQVAAVSVAGTPKTQGTDYTISAGLVTFASPPASAALITADFQWFWRVRFDKDSVDFGNFSYHFWECKQLDLMEVRQ